MTISQRAVEAAARALRERDMAGRITVSWDRVPKVQKKKWIDRGEVALTAALAVDGVAPQGWQPIESASKDGTEIIYLNKFGEIGFCYWSEAVSQFDESLWCDDQADDECCPLYWLPRACLPPPPAASDGEGAVSEQDEPYENSLTVEELRRELRRCWDIENALIRSLKDLPDVAPPRVCLFLNRAAKWREDNNIGIMLQRKHGLTVVPPKSECEGGAGVWYRIRQGMMLPRPGEATPPEGTEG